MIGGSQATFVEANMDYDWTGARTRRLMIIKRTSLFLLSAGILLTPLLRHFTQ
jgi:hypothetical protein